MASKDHPQTGNFPSTHWSLIFSARGEDFLRRRQALEELLRLYLPALRAHLLYRRRIEPHRAEEGVPAVQQSNPSELACLLSVRGTVEGNRPNWPICCVTAWKRRWANTWESTRRLAPASSSGPTHPRNRTPYR